MKAERTGRGRRRREEGDGPERMSELPGRLQRLHLVSV